MSPASKLSLLLNRHHRRRAQSAARWGAIKATAFVALLLVLSGCLGSEEEEEAKRSLYAPGQPLTASAGRTLTLYGPGDKVQARWRARRASVRVADAARAPQGVIRWRHQPDGLKLEATPFAADPAKALRLNPALLARGRAFSMTQGQLTLKLEHLEGDDRGQGYRLSALSGGQEAALGWIAHREEAPFGQVFRLFSAQGAEAELARAFVDKAKSQVILVNASDNAQRSWPIEQLTPAAALVMTLPQASDEPLLYSAAGIALGQLLAAPTAKPAAAKAP